MPDKGDILDVGCGHGLLALSLMHNGGADARRYVGIDHDEDKIAIAQVAQFKNAEFFARDIADIPSESYDCVAVIEVLYCVPLNQWPEFMENCTRALRKGGLLVIDAAIPKVRWKRILLRWEEFLAIKVFRITKGADPQFETLDTYKAHIEAAGAKVVEVDFLDPWRPHSHCLILARKPE